MDIQIVSSPTGFLERMLGELPIQPGVLESCESFWETEGRQISAAVDRSGTPWLKNFDVQGRRIDEICFPPEYWKLLKFGYRAGAVWRAFEQRSLIPSFLIGYLTAFYDTGLYCPYTVSLSTAVPLSKYGGDIVKQRFLPHMLRRDDQVWQGATWMTESGGGSDLGAYVETIAEERNGGWILNGEKYFASNAGAELAVVAARRLGSPASVRGLSLFLLPRFREDGGLNYHLRRMKDKIGTRSVPTGEVELHDSQAYLLGEPEQGIYLILETLNISRVSNCIGSVALIQRAVSEVLAFTRERIAFGKPVAEQPLMRRQIENWIAQLESAFLLGWEAVRLLDEVWQEKPRYSDRYHLFRLMAHLAKYWTAEQAVQAAKWAMEAHGGMGVLAEYGVERLLREAMVLPIWEGTPHRQILDGLEVIQRKQAHELLFRHLAPHADPQALEELAAQLDALLALDHDEMEAQSERVFRNLASFTAETLKKSWVGSG